MTESEIIQKLISALDGSVEDFNKAIPGIQKEIAAEVDRLVRDLEIKDGNIKANVANLTKIAKFRARIEAIFRNSGYGDKVADFIESFNTVQTIQNEYFTKLTSDYRPSKLLEQIKVMSIDSTLESLTEAGLRSNLIAPIQNILQKNITTGGSYADMTQQLRDFITGGGEGKGVLDRYAKQITTDSINQFSGQYMHAVTNDLGLDWFMYTGSLLTTSRPWCEACKKKKYIHRSEFQQLIDGDFPEFKEEKGVIYDKTGLPSGMIAGTNPSNLTVYRGGYNCGHQLIPVHEAAVPKVVRMETYLKEGISFNADGFKIAA